MLGYIRSRSKVSARSSAGKDEGFDGFGVEDGAMFDGVHARFQRQPNAVCAVRVRGDLLAGWFAVSTIAFASSANICLPRPAPTRLLTPPVVA